MGLRSRWHRTKQPSGCITLLNDFLFPDFTCTSDLHRRTSAPSHCTSAARSAGSDCDSVTVSLRVTVCQTVLLMPHSLAPGARFLSLLLMMSHTALPRTLLASSLRPFCAFVKCGKRLLFSLEPLFSFRKRKARAQPITQHNTHTYKGKCMQAQTEVHVASGMYKCRGRGIFRGGGCGGWWRRENRERRRGQEIHCRDSWRRRNAAEEETPTTKTVESVEKGGGAEDGPLRCPGEGAWESRTGSQLQRQSATLRAEKKREDHPADLPENMMGPKRLQKMECVPWGQPVAPKEKRKPKKNTRRRMTAPRETQAKQLRRDAIGKRRAVETAGNAVSLTQAVTERRRCRKGG